MTASPRAGEVVRRIVERVDLDAFTERVLDSFWERPEYQRFEPARDDVRAWVRWNIELVIRWLADDQPPSEADLERFRERARMLAAAGMPPDIVPANFRRGARFAWSSLLEGAREDERPALLESADRLFEFIDRVSQLFSDTYASLGPAVAVSDEERHAQRLLRRARAGEEPSAEDQRFAERIGFGLAPAYRPFAIAAPARSVQQHSAMAGRLRGRHVLAVAEGRRVAGLAHEPVSWRELDLGARGVIAEGRPTPRAELGDALEELELTVAAALGRGRSGPVAVDDHLAELLLMRSPRLAARVRARVYEQLAARDPELTRTLDHLIEHDFDRGATAAALPVHRNTLSNRLNRIRAITGLDVDRADGRSTVWLAWLAQRGAGAQRPG
jgi:PucR C-terminal helix-turn-helix domain